MGLKDHDQPLIGPSIADSLYRGLDFGGVMSIIIIECGGTTLYGVISDLFKTTSNATELSQCCDNGLVR